MKHILDMTPETLLAEIESLGEKKFRAKQILEWVWRKGATDFAAMTNLSEFLRETLSREFCVFSGDVVTESRADDGVVKLLIAMGDGEKVETVMIPSSTRTTVCVSTQVGCALGCTFCASGLGGLVRNLTGGEIIEQVLQLQAITGRKVTNVVFMGMGEPLLNYGATLAAVRALIDERRGGISARKITVSTVGIPEGIQKLSQEDIPVTLAISLHAPNDALRSELIPINRKYPIDDILAAAGEFFEARGREVTLEYTLINGVNDSNLCCQALAKLAGRLRCNVNLIKYNFVPSLKFESPSSETIEAFASRLRAGGVNVNIRESRGLDSEAACGQLRLRKL
ncbi:MAG: 23S rRNA (adenine(2503)-C(2))-methyltransferase RlmN [Phycisphaerae bacterium]|nr:23S rRNA (adenine(2503)-C(2))-methyltransferase RlmN [Phycisphaerae bacterium]